MNLFHQLTEKPWLPLTDKVVDLRGRRAFSVPTATLGLRMFIAVGAVLFSLVIIAYAHRMEGADWRPLADPWLLWVNTFILILSSVAAQWALISARQGQIDGVKAGLLAGGVCALAFLAGQLMAWQQLADLGYFARTNPSVAFFYMITGLHALHLSGGMVAWGRTSAKLWRGDTVNQLRLSVELCALYWHFLLLVWLVMFGLLLIT